MIAQRVDSAPLTIAGPAGDLEAAVDRIADSGAAFVSIVCHPHPLQQGTMQNKVVTTVSRAAARLGGCSLRFNYRGVGASQGAWDGDRGELEDALAVIDHLRGQAEFRELPFVIAGFSFGGAIAYRAALEAQSAALVTIAPAHERIPEQASGSFASWLLVQGEDDEIIPAAGVLEWAKQHTPVPQIARFESTGHFFHGRLPRLADSVSAYLQQALV